MTTSAKPGSQCGCGKIVARTNRVAKWAAAGGVLAAVGVCAACCLLPFALLSIGIAGAWVSKLDAFVAYKWPLIGVALALLAYSFYAEYIDPKPVCAAGAACEACGSSRSVRVGLWLATILILGGIVFERIEPILTSLTHVD